jgi:hypothetical protein
MSGGFQENSKYPWILGATRCRQKEKGSQPNPGPWAGLIVITNNTSVQTTLSKDRWDKAKSMITWIKEQISRGPVIEFKTLERYCRCLVYISQSYPALVPYLKGIHPTMDSWRPWQKDT